MLVSFFILLIVCLGYGIIRPTLGKLMRKCVILAVCHFIFGVAYSFGSMMDVDKLSGIAVMFFVLPLSFTMTLFYYWTLAGLQETVKRLESKRQVTKLLMYTRLRRILVFSIILLFVSFGINAVVFNFRSEQTDIQVYWRYKWVLLDGFLNILYLVIFMSILVLWRYVSFT